MRMMTVVTSALWLAACAHTKPDAMSAQAHREEAKEHEALAEKERRAFDPTEERAVLVATPSEGGGAPVHEFRRFNPTEQHLRAADEHARAAHQHRQAAQELERTELAECRQVSPGVRAACPFLTPYLREVEETRSGVVFRLADRAPADELVEHMRCQIAYARTRAFEGHLCPLYQRGVQVRRLENGDIELRSSDGRVANELREEAQRLFGDTPRPTPAG